MNLEEIAELIKKGKNDLLEQQLNDNHSLADSKTEHGISLLQFAAYCRNNIAVDLLKKHKQKFDIFEASCIGNTQLVNQLLDKNPESINLFSSDGFNVLGLASFFGHLSLVELLLEKGADPNIASNNHFKVAPIHSSCAISHFDITELLIRYGADVNAKQTQGITPLHEAAHNGQIKLLKLLLDMGADINAKMENGRTPLFMANEKHFQETAELIIKHGGH
jgi:uncharacterized protein